MLKKCIQIEIIEAHSHKRLQELMNEFYKIYKIEEIASTDIMKDEHGVYTAFIFYEEDVMT